MNMNKMQVNEEAAKKSSETNQPQKRSDEAEKSYVLNSNAKKLSLETKYSHASISSYPDLIYNPYDQSYFSVNQNQTENSLLQPNTGPIFSSSFGSYSSEFSSSNCLHDQRPKEQEVFQMNPTCQTTGFYEQYDQTKTEDRNQILANIWLDWEVNNEDFSPSMQSGFWVDNTYYQRWSTNSGTF